MRTEGPSYQVVAGGGYPSLAPAEIILFRDLAIVQLVSDELVARYHFASEYAEAKCALFRLLRAGLLASSRFYVAGEKPTRLYRFASRAIASAWGGRLPAVRSGRAALHEILISRAYFMLGCPMDFRVAAYFTDRERRLGDACRPDAVYTDSGSKKFVLVESDSGQYSSRQIRDKITRWLALGLTEQLWIQPLGMRAARVPEVRGVRVLKL